MDATPWYYNDELWNDLSPKFNTSYHWDVAPEEIRMIVDLLKPKPKATVLDLGCGQGRHSLELAKRDLVVTGLDRNQFFLDFVLKKSKESNVEVKLVKADMKTFVQHQAFDLILSLNSSFGYFEDQSEHLQVLKNIHDSLRPSGTCLFELFGKEVVPKMFVEREWTEIEGTYFLDDRRVDKNWSRIINHCRIIKDGAVKDGTFSLTIFSGVEFSAMLRDTGFSKVSLYGDLSGSPYDQHAKKLVAVAVK
jgi:SAM-dependent methyltransferase